MKDFLNGEDKEMVETMKQEIKKKQVLEQIKVFKTIYDLKTKDFATKLNIEDKIPSIVGKITFKKSLLIGEKVKERFISLIFELQQLENYKEALVLR